MSATDDLVTNARAYASHFDRGGLPMPPALHVAVVACMDARLNPYGLLGLHEGDAHVIRNAGGVVTEDEIRSLTISQRLLGTREIILIHHTSSRPRSRRTPDCAPAGHRSRSATPSRTCGSPSPASRRARSSRTRTRSGASSTPSPTAP